MPFFHLARQVKQVETILKAVSISSDDSVPNDLIVSNQLLFHEEIWKNLGCFDTDIFIRVFLVHAQEFIKSINHHLLSFQWIISTKTNPT